MSGLDQISSLPGSSDLHEALDGGVLVWSLAQATPLRLTGNDRIDFLHGQVSNDIRGLPLGGTVRALHLNHKGHALADMTVCRRVHDLYLSVADGAGPAVEASLRSHIIFDQVTIENLEGVLIGVSLQGSGVAGLLSDVGIALPTTGRFVEEALAGAEVLLHQADRSGRGGVDVHLLAADLPDVAEALAEAGVFRVDAAAAELVRVLAGVPAAVRDAGQGVLPQEAGLEAFVSYTKGCYLGQETMARVEARGNLKRGLARLDLAAVPQGSDRNVYAGGRLMGRLGTVVERPSGGALALAVVRRDIDKLEGAVAARAEVLRLEWLD